MLIMEYEGTRYRGSQYQDNGPTIQGETERAIERLTGEKVRIAAASRTDAGVHARGQVVSFRTKSGFPPKTWVRALNHYLPSDIAVKAAYEVDGDFDVRRDAWGREYRYSILNSCTPSPLMRRFTHLLPHLLDVPSMNRACQVLVGEHDFAPFCTAVSGSTRRRVYRAEVSREGDLVTFDMQANSFLPRQVRNTIGALVKVGLGKMKVEQFWELAESGQPGAMCTAAPAKGLCLMRVNYDGFPPLS